jgi:hypothetical protein
MDLLWNIKLEEMLGDLTVAMFLMLLAASFAVAILMVLLPLIELAFEKKPLTRAHAQLLAQDDSWRAGRPWLLLRTSFLLRLMSGLPLAQRRHLTLVQDSHQFSDSRHRTPLIKRVASAETRASLIERDKAPPSQASTPSNAA